MNIRKKPSTISKNLDNNNNIKNPNKKNKKLAQTEEESSLDDSSKLSNKSNMKKNDKNVNNSNYSNVCISNYSQNNGSPSNKNVKSSRKIWDKKKNSISNLKISSGQGKNINYNSNKITFVPAKNWSKNIAHTSKCISLILAKINEKCSSNISDIKKYAFDKINCLSKDIIFSNLLNIKKQYSNLLDLISQQENRKISNGFNYSKILLTCLNVFIKNFDKKFNNSEEYISDNDNYNTISYYNTLSQSINKDSNPKRGTSFIGDDMYTMKMINLQTKENGVSFEYQVSRKRALSSRIEQRLIQNRRSSEEIERNIRRKMDAAERNKRSLIKSQKEQSSKLAEKICEIRDRFKAEKEKKYETIVNKLNKMNENQQQIMKNKMKVIREEHEKVAEVNYINKLKKDTKNFRMKKKINNTIIRRNNYLKERINRVRRHYIYLNGTDNVNDENNNERDIYNDLSCINGNDELPLISSNIQDYNERKKKMIQQKFEFLKKIFNEDFIWELFEADYFDIDQLINVSSLTKFGLIKSKLKKEKEFIDKLYKDGNFKKKGSNAGNTAIAQSQYNGGMNHFSTFGGSYGSSIINSCPNNGSIDLLDDPLTQSGNNLFNNNNLYTSCNAYDNPLEEEYYHSQRRSHSYTIFSEADFSEVDYLFEKRRNKKKARKKKKGNKEKTCEKIEKICEEDEERRKMLLRSLNCNSLKEIYHCPIKENPQLLDSNQKIKKYLIKDETNGTYIQSQVLITPVDLSSLSINNCNNFNLNNINNNTNNNGQNDNQLENKQSSNSIKNENNNSNSNINNNNSNIINNTSNNNINTNNNGNISHFTSGSVNIEQKGSDNENNCTSLNSVPSGGLSSSNANYENDDSKVIQNLIQNNSQIQNPLLTKSPLSVSDISVRSMLEKREITVRWCRICNAILGGGTDPGAHVQKPEHIRLVKEYGLSIQEAQSCVLVFRTVPGGVGEELRNERANAVKMREKKLRQKMALKAVKHENYRTYNKDFQSANKQRIQKLCFDIDKQIFPNIKDYDALESSLKDLIKILEQKKQNDLHILRQTKLIYSLVEVLKKPASCHKSEMKSLGKILELIIKILLLFSSLLENKNYMILTNRLSVIADLLLWVLNKPSKLPLGIAFLPDLIQIIIIHIKHRIPFECLTMKDDLIEYLLLSNIVLKFRQKYLSLTGPSDFSSSFGSFPLVLLKSLGMFESLTNQINGNYLTKPVYVKQTKISENILFMFEYSELFGLVQLLSIILLSNGPIKSKEKIKPKQLPQTVISASLLAVKIINNICRIDLGLVQKVVSSGLMLEQMQHVMIYIICYSLEYIDTSDDIKELLHELLLCISYLSYQNETIQNLISKGEVTIIQHICNLPFNYFSDKLLKDILFPTLICMTYNNERNTKILSNEINLEFIVVYLKEKIQLEPIVEEELSEFSNSINNNAAAGNHETENRSLGLLSSSLLDKEAKSIPVPSTASSAKSCHDMVSGNSDFVSLAHRFPYELWPKAQEYYANFGKN